jgi:hypothetical protein
MSVPYPSPILIEIGQTGVALQRVQLSKAADAQFSERWLQELLFEHPESLPIRDIDPSLGHLVPICMELATGPGPADILYLTPLGKIVLVETKLYRNPEARRTVVAQILDYARALTSWRYETLDRAVRAASKHDPRSLVERVQAAAATMQVAFDETLFVDSINRGLARADVQLLIVGDGITEGTQALVAFLEQHGSLHFSFALVEAAVFQTPSAGYLLQARIVAKTDILRRVLLVDRAGDPVLEAAPEQIQDQAASDESAWRMAFWTDYIEKLRTGLDDLEQPLPSSPGRNTNIYLALPPGRSYCWISAFISKSRGCAGVYFAMATAYEKAADVMAVLAEEKQALNVETGQDLQWGASWTPYYIGTSFEYASIDDPTGKAQVIEALVAMTNRFVNAFLPRMKNFTQK